MTVKRALLAIALGTTIGTSYALWDERDRADRAAESLALATVPADAGALPLPVPTRREDVGTPRERLFADLERAKLEAPPEIEPLLKLQKKGAKPRVLRGYVRRHFPKDARLRLVVGRWIKSLEPVRATRVATAARPRRQPSLDKQLK